MRALIVKLENGLPGVPTPAPSGKSVGDLGASPIEGEAASDVGDLIRIGSGLTGISVYNAALGCFGGV